MKNFDPRKTARVAAGFAISNMGQEVPARIVEDRHHWSYSTDSEVISLADQFMETDEHERIFIKEARMWASYIRKTKREDILRIHGKNHPWIQQIIDAEMP